MGKVFTIVMACQGLDVYLGALASLMRAAQNRKYHYSKPDWGNFPTVKMPWLGDRYVT
jgi:hypothetical protein